jgi:translation elongation factor EF-G
MHPGDVRIEEPRVRLRFGDAVQEPIMWIHAATPRACTEAVIQDLVRRGAEIEEVDWLAARPAVRARAPLRRLLGYSHALAALAGTDTGLRMWLSHYAPVPPEPPEAGNAA